MNYQHHAQLGNTPIQPSLFDHVAQIVRSLGPLPDYQLFVDIWEDQGVIYWDKLDVAMAAIRLNSISGGTHKDAGFDTYWSQCPILKLPYFVYNPWNDGATNFYWLLANLPAGVASILVDIEVIKTGYPAATYAQEVQIFTNLCLERLWNIGIYTAQWFLPYLSAWPKDVEYWWAQWPYQFYPDSSQEWTWDQVHSELQARGNIYPSNTSAVPGSLRAWQFTGDRLILPGSSRPLDVNLFYGNSQELADWVGGEPVKPPADTIEYYSNGRIKVTHGHRETPRPYNFHLAELDHNDIDFIEVTGPGFLRTGSSYFASRAEKFGRPPDLIKQGDEAISGIVKGLGVSLGTIYKLNSIETNVQWDKDNRILGISNQVLPGCYNATGGSNWLVDQGAIHWSVLDEPPEADPRSGIGWDADSLRLGIIDGRNDGTLGLAKAEFAQFFIDRDCDMAHNSDGGDSNLLGVNDGGTLKILNRLVEGEEKQLPQYIGIWLKENDGGSEVATDTYITNKKAQLYNPNGKPREFILEGIVIVCDWLWDSGPLTGMRKILSGYVTDGDRFIKDVDIDPYTETPPDPPPNTGEISYFKSYDKDDNELDTWVPQ